MKDLLKRVKNFGRTCSRMGLANTLLYIYKTKFLNKIYNFSYKADGSYKVGTLGSKQLLHPVSFRYNSSDIKVFSQIFVGNEYLPLAQMQGVNLVIDCGANVGYSSAYFLSVFPETQIIAVEPDPRNYELLKQNLSIYSTRATTICSGVWSHNVGLKVCFEQRGEWATTVRECLEGEQADLEAVDILSLLNQSQRDKIDILKVDIEGSEKVLFSQNFELWINRVRNFAIELHGEECRKTFHQALAESAFSFIRSGEITIARRLDAPTHYSG